MHRHRVRVNNIGRVSHDYAHTSGARENACVATSNTNATLEGIFKHSANAFLARHHVCATFVPEHQHTRWNVHQTWIGGQIKNLRGSAKMGTDGGNYARTAMGACVCRKSGSISSGGVCAGPKKGTVRVLLHQQFIILFPVGTWLW